MDINGFPSPERLKHYPDKQVWSRELSKKDRITYEVFEEEKTILVFRLLGHYNNNFLIPYHYANKNDKVKKALQKSKALIIIIIRKSVTKGT